MRFYVSIFFALAWTTAATAYCSEPSPPYCTQQYGEFNDGYDFEDCKRDIQSFQSEIEDHLECIQREARRESDEAISAYNDAVEGFNRRARGY